jgi:hypothetical protein
MKRRDFARLGLLAVFGSGLTKVTLAKNNKVYIPEPMYKLYMPPDVERYTTSNDVRYIAKVIELGYYPEQDIIVDNRILSGYNSVVAKSFSGYTKEMRDLGISDKISPAFDFNHASYDVGKICSLWITKNTLWAAVDVPKDLSDLWNDSVPDLSPVIDSKTGKLLSAFYNYDILKPSFV